MDAVGGLGREIKDLLTVHAAPVVPWCEPRLAIPGTAWLS
jgi:hypothetical protein